ncbi:hypothetical protein [Pseudomonas aeruginosa]|uniref:hypothetical protein n=1 Tax=Pseudomonas aeruginosa TaxID=287 RepID=UPI0018E0054C|nr:hypothetical protein [Pseudomonas aeruginosa]
MASDVIGLSDIQADLVQASAIALGLSVFEVKRNAGTVHPLQGDIRVALAA